MKGIYFQMCNRSQSSSWNVYVLNYMFEVSTKDTKYSRIVNPSFGFTSLEYQEAYCSRKQSRTKFQLLSFCKETNPFQPFLRLINSSLFGSAGLAGTKTLCHGMDTVTLCHKIEGIIFSLPCRHVVQVTICAGHIL